MNVRLARPVSLPLVPSCQDESMGSAPSNRFQSWWSKISFRLALDLGAD